MYKVLQIIIIHFIMLVEIPPTGRAGPGNMDKSVYWPYTCQGKALTRF